MSNDNPLALQRALDTLREILESNSALPPSVDPIVTKPDSVFDWIETTRKQIAPHADRVPLPIIQGVAKVFPPAGVAVPFIRYLQTSPSKAGARGGSSANAAAGTTATQIFILPMEPKATPAAPLRGGPHTSSVVIRRALLNLVAFCQDRPVLALLVVYGLYRARRVPGKALGALDRAVNRVSLFLYTWVLRKAKRHRRWVVQQTEKLRAQLTILTAGPEAVVPPPVENGEQNVQLDIGDAAWVVIFSLVAIYVAYNRKKIWRRLT